MVVLDVDQLLARHEVVGEQRQPGAGDHRRLRDAGLGERRPGGRLDQPQDVPRTGRHERQVAEREGVIVGAVIEGVVEGQEPWVEGALRVAGVVQPAEGRVVDVGDDLRLVAREGVRLGGEVVQDLSPHIAVVDGPEHHPLEVVDVGPAVDLVLEVSEFDPRPRQQQVADRLVAGASGPATLQPVDHRRGRRDAQLGLALACQQIDEGGPVVGSEQAIVQAGEQPVHVGADDHVVQLCSRRAPQEGQRFALAGGVRGALDQGSQQCSRVGHLSPSSGSTP